MISERNKELEIRLEKLENRIMLNINSEHEKYLAERTHAELAVKQYNELMKRVKEHPEELEQLQAQWDKMIDEYGKYSEEHPEDTFVDELKQIDDEHIEIPETRSSKLEKMLIDLAEIIKKKNKE